MPVVSPKATNVRGSRVLGDHRTNHEEEYFVQVCPVFFYELPLLAVPSYVEIAERAVRVDLQLKCAASSLPLQLYAAVRKRRHLDWTKPSFQAGEPVPKRA